jgi:membrane-bound metal-dependent hydrolase YbcI (DUF457 family)
MINIWAVGILVLMFHDFSDATMIFGRLILDWKRRPTSPFITYPIYAFVFLSWVFCRLIMFPSCCIYGTFLRKTSLLSINFCTFMECGLLVMHIYWTYFIVKSATGFDKRKY